MPQPKYEVRLTESEMKTLKSITHNGSKASAKTILHANILLKSNENYSAQRDVSEK